MTEHGKEAYPTPRCVSMEKHFIKRTCVYRCWLPEEAWSCHETQKVYDFNTHCPLNNIYLNDRCMEITHSQWTDRCRSLGNDVSIVYGSDNWIYSLPTYLKPEYDRVWLPARQLEKFGPYVWILVGDLWGMPVNLNIVSRNKGECLSLRFTEKVFIVEAADCSLTLPMVCFTDLVLRKSNCPNGYYTTNIAGWQDICYGFETIKPSTWLDVYGKRSMMINSPDINYIYQKIMGSDRELQTCWIGLKRFNESFIWTTGMPVSFLNWHIFENYIHDYGSMDADGTWQLHPISRQLNCFANYIQNVIQEAKIVLKFYCNIKRLELTIYAPESLVKGNTNSLGISCFAGASLISYRRVEIGDMFWDSDWNEDSDHRNRKVIYEVVLQKYPETYWCEGFMTNTLKLISSEHIFAYRTFYPHMYSLLWEMTLEMLDKVVKEPNYLENLFPNENIEKFRLQRVLNMNNFNATTIIHMILKETIVNVNNDADIIKSYKIAQEIVKEINENPQINILGINNTLYCIPEQASSGPRWPVTKLDHRATPTELCLQKNGLPVYRTCIGDVIFGAIWEQPQGTCDDSIIPSSTTTNLYSINANHGELINCTDCITDDVHKIIFEADSIIPADVYYFGLILQKLALKSSSDKQFNKRKVITDIVSKIAEINRTSIALSQFTLNSTNIITDSIQRLLEVIPVQDYFLNETNDGKILIRSSEFIYQISNPNIKDISGLGLFKKNDSNFGNLDDYDVKPIYSYQTIEQMIDTQNLEVLTWVPKKLLDRINETTYNNNSGNNLSIIITIYNNDIYFKERRSNIFADKVISVAIPHYGPNLPVPLKILFRQNLENYISIDDNISCNYWSYQPKYDTHNNFGEWYSDGCFRTMELETSKYNLTVCECSHLTNFAQLITGNTKLKPNEEESQHEKNLNMITMIGCALSIIGLTCIFIMAMVYRSWRRKTGTKVLLHLSSAIYLEMALMLFMNIGILTISEDEIISPSYTRREVCCIILGSLLHFSVLSSFSWMVIIAYMQYLRYVRVLGIIRPAKFMQKAAAIAWGCPLLPVLLLLAADNKNYVPVIVSENAICYPSGIALFITVVGPIASMILINMIFYSSVLKAIFYRPKNISKINYHPSLISAQLRLSIFLFFLLGLSWSFALAVALNAGIVFSYLFCLTATLQGFILFIYFVIVDPATRNLWKCCGKPDTVDSNTF